MTNNAAANALLSGKYREGWTPDGQTHRGRRTDVVAFRKRFALARSRTRQSSGFLSVLPVLRRVRLRSELCHPQPRAVYFGYRCRRGVLRQASTSTGRIGSDRPPDFRSELAAPAGGGVAGFEFDQGQEQISNAVHGFVQVRTGRALEPAVLGQAHDGFIGA